MGKLISLMLLTTTFSAAFANQPKDFAEVSTRNIPADDLQALNVKRSEAMQVEQDVNTIETNEQTTVIIKQQAQSSLLNKKGGIYIVGSHYDYPGSKHVATFFSPDGRVVELEDGSQWLVVVRDVPKAAKWLTSEPVAIYPNKDLLFKATNYKLTNLALNETVDVDLIRGPRFDSSYTKYVVAVDTFSDSIYLNDASRWDVSWSDSALTRHWLPSDVVIVGENYGWFSGSYPYILINVSLNQYVCAQRGF